MTKISPKMRGLANYLAKPIILFYALPWLMFLLVLGTIAQRYIGLYQSQKIFFGSFVLWAGFVPLPGVYTVLSLVALCLIAKLLLKSPFKKQYVGSLLTHASILCLLIGGLVTVMCRQEGYMVLGDGDVSHSISDYHQRELVVLKNGTMIMAIPHEAFYAGKAIKGLPFSLNILRFCYQCRAVMQEHVDATQRGLDTKFDIVAAPDKEDEKNQSGVVFTLSGISPKADGTYLTYQALNEQPAFDLGKDKYVIVLRQVERSLPFEIKLIRFQKLEYPGTDMARSYESEVQVTDGELKWNATIEMNQPLRYRGYTFYQSSYVESDGKLLSVLAVVKNSGAIFPYIAIIALCAGLLLHIVIRFLRKRPV